MSKEHYSTMGMDSRKETDRLFPRTLFFSAILLMSHILEIEPSSFDAGGIKIAVKDVSVIHGGLALVSFYYLWMTISAVIEGNIYLPVDHKRRMLRSLVASTSKPYIEEGFRKRKVKKRSILDVKKFVRGTMLAYNIFTTPFALTLIAIIVAAACIGFFDIIELGQFILDSLLADDSN